MQKVEDVNGFKTMGNNLLQITKYDTKLYWIRPIK